MPKVENSRIHTLVASVTKDSIDTLGIKSGVSVIALVKAPQIILVSDFGGYKISARNQLVGNVSSLKLGPVNAEVDIELSGGELGLNASQMLPLKPPC